MANKFWRGTAGDGDWSNTNNWSATRYGATGAGAPASNDDVWVEDGPDITAGLSQGSVDLNSLTISFGGNIGSASTSLTIAVSGTSGATLIYRGTGQFCNITAGTNGIDVLSIESTGAGKFNLTGGSTVDVRCGRNVNLDVAAGAVISGSILTAGGTYTIADNATDIPTGTFLGNSQVTSRRDIDAVIVGPTALYRLLEDATIDGSIVVYGTWQHFSAGTVASATVAPGGVATAVGSPISGFTVTAGVKYEGAQFFEADPTVTWGSGQPVVIGRATR